MKFSLKKKEKMRRYNQRRINRICKNMIGYYIDYEDECIVRDQAKIKGIMYLLVLINNDKYEIYKIVKESEFVKLSVKKVLYNKKNFSNYVYWYNKSIIHINEDGEINFVRRFREY